jgi:hypothetical protein
LDGGTAVWFDCEHLSATITGVQPDPDASAGSGARSKKKKGSSAPIQLLSMDLTVAPDAGVGMHSMRILTPGGISNAISVRVHAEPAMPESAVSHSEPAAAQAISAVPVVISGKLTGGGELDYYAFEARQGETFLLRRADVGDGFRPQPDAV